MNKIGAICTAAIVLATLTPALAQDAVVIEYDLYKCNVHAVDFHVIISPDRPGVAQVTEFFIAPEDGAPRDYELPEMQTGSGFRYGQPDIEFFGQGSEAQLALGEAIYGCEHETIREAYIPADDDVASLLEVADGTMLNGPGRAYGGNVRGGPGTQYPIVGSFPEGTPVIIVSRTQIRTDGFDWFIVRGNAPGNEIAGFVWGGILCADHHIDGVFDTCS